MVSLKDYFVTKKIFFNIIFKCFAIFIYFYFLFQENDHSVYIVMEFCNKGHLGDYMKEQKKLPETTIRLFFKQICNVFPTVIYIF